MRRLFFLLLPLIGALVGAPTGAAVADVVAEPGVTDPDRERLIAVVTAEDPVDEVGRTFEVAGDDGVELVASLDNLGLLIVDVDPAGKALLARSAQISEMVPARTFELFLDQSGPVIESDVVNAGGLTGAGRVVAVLDSGVDTSHPALADAVVAEACFLTGTPLPILEGCPGTSSLEVIGTGSGAPCSSMPEVCSHGTHVAGIISGDDALYKGIAPAVGLISIRVTAIIPGGAHITEEAVLAALDHVVTLAATHNIAAVNLSLGGPAGGCQPAHWAPALDALEAAGIAVVAASGNSGGSAGVAFPACLEGVIAVGATDPGVEVAEFTQYRGGLDLVGPGEDIDSTVLTAFDADGFARFSGTSMAAPHVAAALALLAPTQPSWTLSRMVELLRSTGMMVPRVTADPDDRDPRFPELRLEAAAAFEPFADADHGYWVAAADWARVVGVSTGLGVNQFSPDVTLDRAQAITLLWRMMGSPVPSGPPPFADVPVDAWYTDAVAWAAEIGVTTGVTPTKFGPAEPATRAQIATLIWRLVGEPIPAHASPFVDVPGLAYYADAAAWMAEEEITNGTTSTTFSPDVAASRAHMITFIWRLVNADTAWRAADAIPDLVRF